MLFVGLGGGSAPKRIWRDFPAIDLQVAELDPEVVDVAYKYFALPRSPRLAVDVEDGRRYLQKNEQRWDVIVLDAYYSDSIPFHLATREFMRLVRDRLTPGGIVVANVIGALEGPEVEALPRVLPDVPLGLPERRRPPGRLPARRDGDPEHHRRRGERSPPADGLPPAALGRRAPGASAGARPDARDRAPLREVRPDARRPVLTDDYAPTDALLLVD